MCMTSEQSEGRNGNFLDKDPGPGVQDAIQRLFEQSTGAVIRAVSGSPG